MSAIPTDEPAQDPPPSIEPQQLQHLQQQQLQQQQQLADVQSPPTTDQTRKRTYFIFSSPGRGLISSPYYPQQRHRPYEELALHVTPAKQDVACATVPGLLSSFPFPSARTLLTRSPRVVSNEAWATLVPIQILMHKIIMLTMHLVRRHITRLPSPR